jgi:hypothetical protein
MIGLLNGIKLLTLAVLVIISGYEPLGDSTLKLYNIIWSDTCNTGGDRLVVGLDRNMNRLIDACYSIKTINGELYYKRVNIFYERDIESNTVIEQGCVCDGN